MNMSRALARYRILEKVGEGAMGEVYRAEDLQAARKPVAVKALKASRLGSAADRARFQREAQAISQIDHPNVVMLLEVIEDGDGLYLIMQYARGRPLRDILLERRLTIDEALAITQDVAMGLAAAHGLGLVHCDIKPDNIMVGPDGSAKILDFGIAYLAGTVVAPRSEVFGTPQYMAPEVLSGAAPDPRADIYALGATLYEMVAGHPPFTASTREALYQSILRGEPTPLSASLSEVSVELEAIVARAMARRPEDRYPSAVALAHDVKETRRRIEARRNATTKAMQVPIPRRGWPPIRSLRAARLMPLLVLALIAGVFLAREWASRRDRGSISGSGAARVMVAPFENLRGDSTLAWLSGAWMDGLIASLDQIEQVWVVPRSTVASAMSFVPEAMADIRRGPLVDAAREAGATHLVIGSFHATSGPASNPSNPSPGGESGAAIGAVHVTCQLQDLRNGRIVMSRQDDLGRLDSDLIPAIDAMALAIGSHLGTFQRVTTGASAAQVPHDTRSVRALQYFQEGLSAFERHDFATAQRHLEKAVAADSALLRAYLILGRVAPEASDRMRFLTLALRYRHGAPPPLPALAEAYWHEAFGDDRSAVARYESVLASNPDEMMARNSLAAVYLRRREWIKVIGELEAIQTQNPFDFSYYPNLIIALLEIGKPEEAVNRARQWRARFPAEPAPLRYLITVEALRGQYVQALALCDTLAALAAGWDLSDRGNVLAHLGRMQEAEAALTRWNENPGSYLSRSRPLAQHAYVDYLEGDPGPGRERIARALAIQDDYYNRWVAGLLAVEAGDLEAAEEHARAIAEAFGNAIGDTTSVEAFSVRRFYFHLRGEIEKQRGRRAEAVEAHRRAVDYSSRVDFPVFGLALGRSLAAAGDLPKANQTFEQVLSLNPNHPETLLELGRTALARGDTTGALRWLSRVDDVWREADRDYVRRRELNELLAAARAQRSTSKRG